MNASEDDRITMLQNINPGQLACRRDSAQDMLSHIPFADLRPDFF